ncbi:class III lanthionine synthetase LanKC [Kribbella sp. DT2]|uniref:class III lanthionine synthetase LanKC n=1 Tax=Kribbella sp. DT2 TaxID=3393427 RepID=UPI003CF0AFD4
MWAMYNLYAQQDRRWYEPLDRYNPDPELLAVHRRLVPRAWGLRRRGLWFIVDVPGATLVPQGWKLHVSTAPDRAEQTLADALEVLVEQRVPFKFLLDRRSTERTLAKRWSRGSAGKFITVYPATDEEFLTVAKELADAVGDTGGPHILSDRPVPGSTSVFYRYGGFLADRRYTPDGVPSLMLKAPDGSDVPDYRQPYYSVPSWATDPFGEAEPEAGVPLLDDGRYRVESALAFSNGGGVYTGAVEADGSPVILKEARPGVMASSTTSALEALEREHRILEKLADTGHFVRPRGFFSESGHHFLVEDRVTGPQMSTRSVSTNPLHTLDLTPEGLRGYYATQQRWWLQLADAIAAAHARGVVLADLSFTNVLIDDGPDGSTPDSRLVVIDLEAAIEHGVDAPLGLTTPGVSSPRVIEDKLADGAGDYYALGALMLGSLHPVNAAVGFHPELLPGFLEALRDDLALPPGLTDLIGELMDPAAQGAGPDPVAVRRRIEALDFATHRAWDSPVPLLLPATGPTSEQRAHTVETARGLVDTIMLSGDPTRSDRLFPGHPLQHETNPYSVGYGAAGVLHTLLNLSDEVADGSGRRSRLPGMATSWLLAAPLSPARIPPGLYTGLAGVAWTLDEAGQPDRAREVLRDAVDHPLLDGEPGMLQGIAGVGTACLRLWRSQGDASHLDNAVALAERLVLPHGPIGYAYGGSGVSTFLLYLALATGDDKWQSLSRTALRHDLEQLFPLNDVLSSFPSHAPDDGENPTDLKPYWDHGTAGVATAVLRQLAVAPDDELRQAWDAMRADLVRSWSVMPQLYHGLSGLGMALLDAAELIGDEQAGLDAWRTAEGVLRFVVGAPDQTSVPGEQCLRESVDLATGASGVLMFLDRLTRYREGSRTNNNFLLDDLLP